MSEARALPVPSASSIRRLALLLGGLAMFGPFSIDTVLKDPATRTADMGGKLGCKAFAQAVADRLG